MRNSLNPSHIGFVGSSIGEGQSKYGVEMASYLVRNLDFLKKIEKQGHILTDFGDAKQSETKQSYEQLSKLCAQSAAFCDVSLIMGGDHSQAIGSIHGLVKQKPKTKVIWIDAHGDINTPQTSPSGNLHGMPLAALMGLFDLNKQKGFEWFKPCLGPQDVALIGVRDLDEGEKQIIKKEGIFCLTTEEVNKMGAMESIHKALTAIDPLGECPIHLSLDVDALSAEYITATGLPVPGGLTPEQITTMTQSLYYTGLLSSLEIVEFNPTLAETSQELKQTLNFIEKLFSIVTKKPRNQIERNPQYMVL